MSTTVKPVDFINKVIEIDPKDLYLSKDLGFIEKPGFVDRLIQFFFSTEYTEKKLGIVSQINTFVEGNKEQLLTLTDERFEKFHGHLNTLLTKKLSPKTSDQRTQLEAAIANIVEARKPKQVEKQTFDHLWIHLANADSSHHIESNLIKHLHVSGKEASKISREIVGLTLNRKYHKGTFQQLLKGALNIVIV